MIFKEIGEGGEAEFEIGEPIVVENAIQRVISSSTGEANDVLNDNQDSEDEVLPDEEA